MAIGRPIELTPNITQKNISVASTEGQTEFTVTGGYRINEIGVYRNGVRLADGRDFAATDGKTVTLISDTVEADDIIEFSVFDNFDIAGVIVGAASSQTLSGNLHVTGELYAGTFAPENLSSTNLNVGGIGTIGIASVTDIRVSGSATVDGTTEFTGVTTTGSDVYVGDALDVAKDVFVGAAVTINGAVTAGGAVNIDATTDSTSSTTGALIVDGGLGVAKNVYIGAGLSIAGTLTYEDVTNVDSVGMVTAKSGVNVSGGELNVGLGFSVGNAGIITSTGGIIDLKNSGSVSNIKLYCESSNAHYTALQSAAHSAYSGNVTLTLPATTDTLIGRTTTDTLTNKTLTAPTIDTASFSSNLTVGSGITFGSAGVATFSGTADVHLVDNVQLKMGDSSDFQLYHNGTDNYIIGTTGDTYVRAASQVKLQAYSGSEDMLVADANSSVKIYYDNSEKFRTTNDGVSITGIVTTSAGVAYTGLLREAFAKTGGKLSDNTNIDLEDGMVHYFTTTESTTSTPNLRWNSSFSLTNKMNVNDAITVTIITTAAAAGYSANLTIDGNAVTEQWVGGSAPSAGGSDGYDIYTYNILKIGTGTGDSGFFVIGNVVNAT